MTTEKTQTAKVEVYATLSCPFCIAAFELLQQHGIEFELHDLSRERDRRAVTEAILPGHRTVPLVLIDGEPVGGFQELRGIASSGQLVDRVFASRD